MKQAGNLRRFYEKTRDHPVREWDIKYSTAVFMWYEKWYDCLIKFGNGRSVGYQCAIVKGVSVGFRHTIENNRLSVQNNPFFPPIKLWSIRRAGGIGGDQSQDSLVT